MEATPIPAILTGAQIKPPASRAENYIGVDFGFPRTYREPKFGCNTPDVPLSSKAAGVSSTAGDSYAMRVPWPSHLNLKIVMYFGLALMVAQLLMGTNPLFSVGILYFIMVAAIGFNVAGGLNTFSGSYIGFMALETIIIAQIAKLFYLQAADTHLMAPLTTIAVYDIGITCVSFAAFVASKYRRKDPFFNANKDGSRMVGMSIAASMIGMVCYMLLGLYGFESDLAVQKGSFIGLLNQFGAFLPLGILIGTAFIIKQSQGTRSARWWTIVPVIFLTLYGIAVESKQGIFQPILIWLVVCASYGYKLNRKQVIGLVCAAGFSAYIVFPVVQYMRGFTRTGDIINRGKLVYEYLANNDLLSIREAYITNEELREEGSANGYFYYGSDKELLDRLSLIETEDAIIYRTEVSMPRGMKYMADGFLSQVPRKLWHGKDKWEEGAIAEVNEMGREIGVLQEGDETTFISFSLMGSTFYMVGWLSAPLIIAVMIPFFWIIDSFYGNIRTNIFCLFVVMANIHGAPEFALAVAFSTVVHVTLITWITISFIRKVSPAITIFLGNRGMLTAEEAPNAKTVRDNLAAAKMR